MDKVETKDKCIESAKKFFEENYEMISSIIQKNVRKKMKNMQLSYNTICKSTEDVIQDVSLNIWKYILKNYTMLQSLDKGKLESYFVVKTNCFIVDMIRSYKKIVPICKQFRTRKNNSNRYRCSREEPLYLFTKSLLVHNQKYKSHLNRIKKNKELARSSLRDILLGDETKYSKYRSRIKDVLQNEE